MGVTFHEFKFLEYFSNTYDFGDVLTLGKQEIILDEDDKKKLNLKNFDCAKDEYIDNLLKEKFSAQSVKSIDNSSFEGADLIHDFNKPIKESFEKFDTILDFGTSEHIFNVNQSFNNIYKLCKSGGNILHSLPANNNCGHGFWQFSPELFFSLYSEENGFSETEIFIFNTYDKYSWWKVKKQISGDRLEISSNSPLYILVKTVKKLEKNEMQVQQSDYIERWNNKIDRQLSKKSKLSIYWKLIKDGLKKSGYNLLPKKISDKIKGKNIIEKSDFKKNKNLEKIVF